MAGYEIKKNSRKSEIYQINFHYFNLMWFDTLFIRLISIWYCFWKGSCIVCIEEFLQKWSHSWRTSTFIISIQLECCMQIFGMRILYEVSIISSKMNVPLWLTLVILIDFIVINRPLETAEENISRLSGYKGTDQISLPYAECCTVKSAKQLQTQCPNCPARYCSSECLR